MSIVSWIKTPHVTINGTPVAIDRKVMSSRMLEVLSNGSYEKIEAAQIPQIVEAGDRVVELGGGTGYISALVGKQKKASKITVYEANPQLISTIKRTHELNRVDVDVVNAVVLPSPTEETVPFYLRCDFWASSLSSEPYG
jgi:spermidine synthase